MNLRDETIILTRAKSRRIRFNEETICKWTAKKGASWPQPIQCGPQREHRWCEIDIAKWMRWQMRNPAPKCELRGVIARKRKKERAISQR